MSLISPALEAYRKPAHQVLQELGVVLERGLSKDAVKQKMQSEGKNIFATTYYRDRLMTLKKVVANPLVWVLVFMVGAAVFYNDFLLAAGVFVILLITAGLAFFEPWRAERMTDSLVLKMGNSVPVMRDGEIKMVPGSELVTGDIVNLNDGFYVPADMRIIEARGLRTDESWLTGQDGEMSKESTSLSGKLPIEAQQNMAWAGSMVVAGQGVGVVVATGTKRQVARILGFIRASQYSSQSLWQIYWYKLGIIAAAIFLSLLTLYVLLLVITHHQSPTLNTLSLLASSLLGNLFIGATILYVVSMIRLLQHGLVLRNPQSMEALSRTSLVALPITALLDKSYHKIKGFDFLQGFRLQAGSRPQEEWQKLPLIGLALAAHDEATLEFIKGQGLSALEVRKQWKLVRQLHDNADWNYRAMLVTHPSQATHDLFVTGSPLDVLHHSAWRLNERGESLFLTSPARFKLEENVRQLYSQGYELMGVAVKRHVQDSALTRIHVHELIWLGVLVTELKVDEGAAASIHKLRDKGLRPVLMTDAAGPLAQALAYKAGLPSTSSTVLTGAMMRHMDDKHLQAQMSHVSVLAEITPLDKQRVVRLWEQSGQQIALLSDAFQDVQVIGQVAMGMAMSGSALATQDAAQGLLLHDSLKTVAVALPVARALQAKWRVWLYIMAGIQVAETVGCIAALWFNWTILAPLDILTINVVGVCLLAALVALF